MDALTKRRVCELIAGLIAADGDMPARELQFMLRTFEVFGVASGVDDEALHMMTTPQEAAHGMGLLPQQVRKEAFDLLLDAAEADGDIAAAERSYLHTVGRAAGMASEAIDRRIDERRATLSQR